MLNNSILVEKWQLSVVDVLKNMQIEYTKDDIVNHLYRVFEEIGYLDPEVPADSSTLKGYVILNKILFSILRTENPDQEVKITIN